jgi:Protein kinase domain
VEVVDSSRKNYNSDIETPVKKLTKMDLEYMLNWDPEQKSTNTPARHASASVKASKPPSSGLERIDETPSASTRTNLSSESQATEAAGKNRGKQQQQRSVSRGQSLGVDPSAGRGKHKSRRLSQQEAEDVLTDVNADFLPLIKHDNMIRVNKASYAKLCVVGTGASCKVYKAISGGDFSIVAIKKVNIDKSDKKAIEGYANEIALLNRLRGNPSIIQLFDSQVDLHRKVILLVMEPGEADLNKVLQQQAASAAEEGGRTLNMNFIRLTWQQMLKAVHSIHEERIMCVVHGVPCIVPTYLDRSYFSCVRSSSPNVFVISLFRTATET